MNPILLVEDDVSLGSSISESLQKENYSVTWCQSLAEARAQLQQTQKWSLAILDVGLPDGSGFDLGREIKSSTMVPLIFLTAWNTAENRLEGYEIGAEEFVPKPFLFRELLLRIGHVLEAHTPSNKKTKKISLAEGTLDLEKMCFQSRTGEMTFFPMRDFQVLESLIKASPQPLSRDEILNQSWGHDAFPNHRTVDNTIVRLRQALRDQEGNFIRSVRGLGYQWVVE